MIYQLCFKEAKMAAKLLVKRFGIKDVSKNRHKTSIRIVLCHQQTLPVWIYCWDNKPINQLKTSISKNVLRSQLGWNSLMRTMMEGWATKNSNWYD